MSQKKRATTLRGNNGGQALAVEAILEATTRPRHHLRRSGGQPARQAGADPKSARGENAHQSVQGGANRAGPGARPRDAETTVACALSGPWDWTGTSVGRPGRRAEARRAPWLPLALERRGGGGAGCADLDARGPGRRILKRGPRPFVPSADDRRVGRAGRSLGRGSGRSAGQEGGSGADRRQESRGVNRRRGTGQPGASGHPRRDSPVDRARLTLVRRRRSTGGGGGGGSSPHVTDHGSHGGNAPQGAAPSPSPEPEPAPAESGEAARRPLHLRVARSRAFSAEPEPRFAAFYPAWR